MFPSVAFFSMRLDLAKNLAFPSKDLAFFRRKVVDVTKVVKERGYMFKYFSTSNAESTLLGGFNIFNVVTKRLPDSVPQRRNIMEIETI